MDRWLVSTLCLLLLLLGAGCASAGKVPDIDDDSIPPAKLLALNPREVRIDVVNRRKINIEAGNAQAVAARIEAAIRRAVEKGGLSARKAAPHRMVVQIEDYAAADAEGECVAMKGVLTAKWGATLLAESHACHYLKHVTGISFGGNESEAYEKALKMMLGTFESNQKALLGWK